MPKGSIRKNDVEKTHCFYYNIEEEKKMRSITKFTTTLTEEEVYQRMNCLMINNLYAAVQGKMEWARGARMFSCNYKDGNVTIEVWVHDYSVGEIPLEGGFPAPFKKAMKEIIIVIIEILKAPESEVFGYYPIIKGTPKVSRNYETLERKMKTTKGITLAKMNLIQSSVSIGISVVNWIIMLAAEMIYFYLPIMGILLGISAFLGHSRAKKRNEETSTLSVVLATISIVLSGLAIVFYISTL